MNKQPFYHRAVILFTATRDVASGELESLLKSYDQLKVLAILPSSVEVEECDSEAGDPADLME